MGIETLKPAEHAFKAMVFNLFKLFLKQGQKDFRLIDGNAVKKVLFLRPEKLGDMVISFPVFDGLRKNFPHIKISILGSPRNRAIIKNDLRFDKIYMYLKKPFRDFSTLMEMRKANYDCVIDMIGDDSVTALFLSQLSAPGKPRIGIGKSKYKQYYDYNYAYRTDNRNHVIENTLKLLDAFGIDSSQISGYAEPFITVEEDCFAKEYINSLKNGSHTEVYGYNLSAGSPTRIWAEENAVQLLKQIQSSNPNGKIVLMTTPDERKRAEKLKSELNNSVVSGSDDNIFDITVEQVFSTFSDLLSERRMVKQ